MTHFVIYSNPSDFPGKYVTRQWFIGRSGIARPAIKEDTVYLPEFPVVADTLIEARSKVPHGFTRTQRHPKDDPVIIESWI